MFGTAVEQLQSGIEATRSMLAALEDPGIDRDDLVELVLGLERRREQLDAAILSLVAELDERRFHEVDAAYSMANWLSSRTGQTRNQTGTRVHLAVKLRTMPALLGG